MDFNLIKASRSKMPSKIMGGNGIWIPLPGNNITTSIYLQGG